MRVLRAAHAGACFGVMRALRLAEETLEQSDRVKTLGPLIHNPTVVGSLKARGAVPVDDVDETSVGDTLLIRSHGTTPVTRERAAARGLEVVDATCPHVARAQKAAFELAESGHTVVIVGEMGHPEVEALAAWVKEAKARYVIAPTASDLPANLEGPIGVVVQTTQTQQAFDDVVSALRARGLNPTLRDTICFATRERQEAAMEVASAVEAMVIVGGRNSANTQRLAELCVAQGAKTYAVESELELNPTWFADVETVGVSAGASTPEDQINRVIAWLEALDRPRMA